MPIDRSKYPDNWQQISYFIRFVRASGRCEGSPAYPNCRAEHGKPHPQTGATVYLTTAHLDHDPQNNSESNLAAWCQRCHNTFDGKHRAGSRYRYQHRFQHRLNLCDI